MPIIDKELPPRMQAKWRARLSSAGREDVVDTCTGDLNGWLERAYSFHKPMVPDGADSAEYVVNAVKRARISSSSLTIATKQVISNVRDDDMNSV